MFRDVNTTGYFTITWRGEYARTDSAPPVPGRRGLTSWKSPHRSFAGRAFWRYLSPLSHRVAGSGATFLAHATITSSPAAGHDNPGPPLLQAECFEALILRSTGAVH